MTIRIHGLKNCDTCRKARKWLDAEDMAYEFIDLREATPALKTLQQWHAELGNMLLNRRGTTWRQLSDTDKARAEKETELPKLLHDHPALMKRPVLETDDSLLVGFNPQEWQKALT